MPDWAQSGLPLVGFLFVVVCFRAQGTYWLARSIPAAVSRWGADSKRFSGLAKWVNGPVPAKGKRILENWGIISIPLCFLTVGTQTAVLAGSGLVRMNWGKFTAAMLPGAVAWAFLYGYGLLAVWMTVLKAAAGSPWAWAVLAALVGSIFVIKNRAKIKTAALSLAGPGN